VDREGGGYGAVETGCQGGQGSPRAVAPGGWNPYLKCLGTYLKKTWKYKTKLCLKWKFQNEKR